VSPSATPTYVWDRKDSGQLFVVQQAVAYGVKTFYGNAWSVPALMEMNSNENNGGYLCGATGQMCKSGDWKQAYADCLIQWSKYYAIVWVNITHLGFLNEPENAYAPLSPFPFPLYFVLKRPLTV
jgi:O-glycosyl hydrolase